MTSAENLFEIRDLSVQFRTADGIAKAVNGVSIEVARGERVAIVGESGCGKTATLLAALRLLPTPPAHVTNGEVLLDGEDLLQVSDSRMRALQGAEVSMVFQDALSSFNPIVKVGRQISEGAAAHRALKRRAAEERSIELMWQVGIPDPAVRAKQYSHQLSGGMRQRAMIAMALAGNPRLLIADEPTTALDVTIQAQILDMIRALTDLSLVWVSHDLGVVAGLAQRVYVMYAGSIVEEGDVRSVFHHPLHPYTEGLLSSVPRVRTRDRRRLDSIPGLPPILTELPRGCPFYERCPIRVDHCVDNQPPLVERGGQRVACWVRAGGEPGLVPAAGPRGMESRDV
ncbi:ABC transporter ATP-binding protein [Cumulibacter manganitolerans]|uniref:ABC transporter ATP-binding protein n=1 Tax=Cumulibacter manganitolerans TaxID=1884992 RepID=UPI001295A251|nr:ABC transporter ATP-binding protein [Cumulibacter manganitolerans]